MEVIVYKNTFTSLLYHLYSESQKLETMPISINKRIEKCHVVYSVNTIKGNELLIYVTI